MGPFFIKSTACNHASWNPLHSIGIHWATLHGIHFIQSGSIGPICMQSTAFTPDAFHTAVWNTVHSITLHGIHCIQSVSITQSCINPPHPNQKQCTTLHESTALKHASWNPLHSIGISYTKLHGIHFIQSRYNAPLCMNPLH